MPNADFYDDRELDVTFFAPIDQAASSAGWEDWKGEDPRLIGSLLYHTVPFQVSNRPLERQSNLVVGSITHSLQQANPLRFSLHLLQW